MIQRKSAAAGATAYAHYVLSKVGVTGLSVTADVYESGTLILSGSAATEVGGGAYKHTVPSTSLDANGEYLWIFKTTNTTGVDQAWLPALWVTPVWVDSIDALISSRAASGEVTSVGPVAAGGDIEVVQGDDYYATQGRSLTWSSTGWPSLSSTGTVTLALTAKGLNGGSWTATPTAPTVGSSSQTVRVELASSDTSLFALGDPAYSFDITATTTDGHKATLVRASVTVLEQYTT